MLMRDFAVLLAKAHPASYELVEKVMIQVDNTLAIGLNRLNWLSKNLEELFLPAEEKISFMSDFLGQIFSLIVHRIEEPIVEVSRFEILDFPEEPVDLSAYLREIREQILSKANKLNSLSMQIESTVLHVIKMFFDKAGYKSKPFERKIPDMGQCSPRSGERREEFICLSPSDLMQLTAMQRLAIQMFVQEPMKSEKKPSSARNATQFILQPSNEWERFNELCKQWSVPLGMQSPRECLGNEFLSSFETRFIEALTMCARNTFEMIKTRANPSL